MNLSEFFLNSEVSSDTGKLFVAQIDSVEEGDKGMILNQYL